MAEYTREDYAKLAESFETQLDYTLKRRETDIIFAALRIAASGGVPEGWRPIETAPKDGTVIWIRRIHEGRRIYEGSAAWRTVTFAALHDPITGERFADERSETGWMKPHENHRVPEPTHWQPLSPPPEPGK